MKKTIASLLIIASIFSCKTNTNAPDVSNIKVDIKLQRFDRDFFSIDSNNVEPGLNQLHNKAPLLTSIFLNNVLGLDSSNTLFGVKRFIHLNLPLYDSANSIYKNTDKIEKDFKKAFQFVNYYFPNYKVPQIVTTIGPVDALAKLGNDLTPDFLGPDFLGISLQFYLGKDFSLYKDAYFIDNVAPLYRSRRFSKEYIVSDAMKLITDDLFQDKSGGKSLIDQMIERGKQWWLLDKFLPETPDSIKTGYTQQQLDWCKENEGLVWGTLLKNEDINTIDPVTIQNYIGESPFTQGYSQEFSPGDRKSVV